MQGPAGPTGPAGPQGLAGLVSASVVYNDMNSQLFGSVGIHTVTAVCNAGDVAIGGGCDLPNSTTLTLSKTMPSNNTSLLQDPPTSWVCTVSSTTDTSYWLTTWAICVDL